MAGSSGSQRRIILSAIVGVLIVSGAYVFVLAKSATSASASGTDDILSSLASKDSDKDGLPDWEEELYGTDPQNAHSVRSDLTDAEAVAKGLVTPPAASVPDSTASSTNSSNGSLSAPATLTEQFARNFYTAYMQKVGNTPLTPAQEQQMSADLITAFKENAQSLFVSHYTLTNLTVDPNAKIDVYAHNVETIFSKGSGLSGETDPATLVDNAAEKNDAEARASLGKLSSYYASISDALAQIPVPSSLAAEHLALVQSFDVSSLASAAMTQVASDPLLALASISIFGSAPQTAFDSLQKIVAAVVQSYGTPTLPSQGGYALRQLILSAPSQTP